jgi:hypothetical protein
MAIHKTTQIEVIERQKVIYKQHEFLIFFWWIKEKTENIGRDIVIKTNDQIENIYLNGREIKI